MGVPGFYSWLIKRYPLVKHMVDKYELPSIDYLYLDMNGIIYKCVKDQSIIFKSQILPKELQQIWIEIFNYIDMIVRVLKPSKTIVMGFDGVAPRSKMNNQRARRFKSGRDHKRFMETYYGFTGDTQSQENFKNNSISPGTQFMENLNKNIDFFIKKKIEEDDYWKKLSVIFTGSDVPGQGEHKIMEFIRANSANFLPQDNHCLYGADADLIMLSMTLPIQNLCIIREQYIPSPVDVKIIKSKQKKAVQFQIIFVTILREYFEIEYQELKDTMKIQFDLKRVMADFVFLFFFIGNDFLPRCMAYNIRQSSIQCLINAFKTFLNETQSYITGQKTINIFSLTLLAKHIAQYEPQFLEEKAEDMSKMMQSKMQFDTQLTKMMKIKAKNEQQFLLALKNSYMSESTEDKSRFYEQKFQITPSANIDAYYQILNFYLYGLEFVYEYYFTRLPSWQWYYPYYYAPLLSDFYYFLINFVQSGYQIQQIDQGRPSQPFKQLMCILPKQSADLLPKAFYQPLTSPDSPLRQPFDFYPDEFEDDMYGSTRPHEAISLIPFLNLEMVNDVYQKAIKEVPEEQLRRNRFGESILYEYNESGSQIEIQSDFQAIEKVRCTITMTNVDLRTQFKWKNLENINNVPKKFQRMPTLKTLEFFLIPPVSLRQKSFILTLKMNEQGCGLKIGQEVFYGYPLEHSGKIEAVLRTDDFVYNSTKNEDNVFDPYNYELDLLNKSLLDPKVIMQQKREVFDWVKNEVMKKYKNKIQWSKVKQLVFIKDTMSFMRCRNGQIRRIYSSNKRTTFTIIPAQLVYRKRTYETTRQNLRFQDVTEQFTKGQDVLCFPKHNSENKNDSRAPQTVIKGIVTGFSSDLKKVKIQITNKIKGIGENVLKPIINTNQIYYTLRFSAFLVGLKHDILLTLLDSISILTQSADLPPSIDIGLNFISRKQEKIVPNLVRIRLGPSYDKIQKQFNKLEISQRGLDLILEYKEKFPHIFNFIVERHEKLVQNKDENGKIRWKESITLNSVFKEEDKSKSLKSLVNVYLWLIKKQESHMPLSSVFSKQVSKNKIQEMINIFEQQEKRNAKNRKYAESKEITVDPNFLFSRRLANICSFHLQRDSNGKYPKEHTIRDQVICLKPEFFGDYGIIVGVDNNQYEVLFKKPRFGKTDLNGLCKKLHGGKFSQRQLYNMDIYPKHIVQRSIKTIYQEQNIGFLVNQGDVRKKYNDPAIDNVAAIQKLAEELQKLKKNKFSQKFLSLVAQAKIRQKVEKIDKDFIVVDNHRRDYKYKYDKGESNLDPSFTKNMVKEIKYREKTAQEIVNDMKGVQGDYDKEVIESKILPKQEQATEQKKETTKEEQENEEEDGDDILTAV